MVPIWEKILFITPVSLLNLSGPTWGIPSTTITDSTPSVSVGLFFRKSPKSSENKEIHNIAPL